MQILGHEVAMEVNYSELNSNCQSDIINTINRNIINGDKYGSVTTRAGLETGWNIVRPPIYLDIKLCFLKQDDEVMLEHNNRIYKIFLNSSGEYEYSIFDEEFELLDGGCLSCSADEAIEEIVKAS